MAIEPCSTFSAKVLGCCIRSRIPERSRFSAKSSAKKTDKQDWIELVNSDFSAGRIKIKPGSDLAHELSGLQWDLSRDSKMVLARTGRLREDPQCPNHLCDALLYLYKYSYHFWSESTPRSIERGTESWWAEYEKQQLEKALSKRRDQRRDPTGFFAWKEARRWTS